MGASLTQGKCYPLREGRRDIDVSTDVMDMGWEGGGSSCAHCFCAKAGWGVLNGPEIITS